MLELQSLEMRPDRHLRLKAMAAALRERKQQKKQPAWATWRLNPECAALSPMQAFVTLETADGAAVPGAEQQQAPEQRRALLWMRN